MNNQAFLTAIKQSFSSFIASGTSRSTQKLKPLHGAIAKDLKLKLGQDYTIKSQGIGDDKEGSLQGRYVDKAVDITVYKKGRPVAGVAVKFVMQNYSQNSVNYFENMLGETANIRSNGYPYFQIFIILDQIPYYKKEGVFEHWEIFTPHNIAKYAVLSTDNVDDFRHTPNKTLVFVAHVTDCGNIRSKADYLSFYRTHNYDMTISRNHYDIPGSAVILNDYETFMDKVYHTIMAL
jgi:hypothetical protein